MNSQRMTAAEVRVRLADAARVRAQQVRAKAVAA